MASILIYLYKNCNETAEPEQKSLIQKSSTFRGARRRRAISAHTAELAKPLVTLILRLQRASNRESVRRRFRSACRRADAHVWWTIASAAGEGADTRHIRRLVGRISSAVAALSSAGRGWRSRRSGRRRWGWRWTRAAAASNARAAAGNAAGNATGTATGAATESAAGTAAGTAAGAGLDLTGTAAGISAGAGLDATCRRRSDRWRARSTCTGRLIRSRGWASTAHNGWGGDWGGRSRAQGRRSRAGFYWQANRERGEPSCIQRIRFALWQGPDISVEVVETTRACVSDILARGSTQDLLRIPGQGELLLPDAHVHFEWASACRSVEGLGVRPWCHVDGSGGFQQADHKYWVLHVFPAIRLAVEVVPTGVAPSLHSVICRVAVHSPRRWPVPVDDLVVLDILIDRLGSCLVRGNERPGQVPPPVMRHIIHPLWSSIVFVLRRQGRDVVRLAIVVPGDDLHERRAPL